jgi:hypothetical protein
MTWNGLRAGSGNSKFEIRRRGRLRGVLADYGPEPSAAPTNQIQNSNNETAQVSNFGHSNLIRHSNFGFRVLLLTGLLGFVVAPAQDVSPTPFYYASATPYDAQDKTLIVGANQSLGQAVVSGDRKHVTLDLDTGLLGSAGVAGFTYQRAGRGFVGSASAAPAASPGGGNGLMPTIKTSPSDIEPDLSVLDKPGMVLIAPLER